MTRDTIEPIVRAIYDARKRADLDGILRHFSDDAVFSMAGSSEASAVPFVCNGTASIRETLQILCDTFDFHEVELVDLIVDWPKAVAHSRVRVHVPRANAGAVTDIVDIIRVESGVITSMTQFVDTALAVRLTTPA